MEEKGLETRHFVSFIIIGNVTKNALQQAVDFISSWSQENRLQLNPSKCKELQSCFTRSPPTHSPVELDGLAFESVNSAKVLGVTIRDDFKWNDHIFNVTSKAAKRLYLLSQLKRAGICASDLVLFYCSTIRSVLEYACQVFHSSLPYYLSEELERIQKRALRIIFPYASYNSALKEAGIPSLYDRRASLSSDLFNDIVLDINHKLAGLLPPKAEHHRQLLSNRKFNVPVCKTDRLKKSFISISIWERELEEKTKKGKTREEKLLKENEKLEQYVKRLEKFDGDAKAGKDLSGMSGTTEWRYMRELKSGSKSPVVPGTI
ncbi:uncharacterized protein [Porites lutea]|uniref:uncharacterized protein n=1 Tax=Porites lutea TaxID=51062 RepID=UPI003CC5BD02